MPPLEVVNSSLSTQIFTSTRLELISSNSTSSLNPTGYRVRSESSWTVTELSVAEFLTRPRSFPDPRACVRSAFRSHRFMDSTEHEERHQCSVGGGEEAAVSQNHHTFNTLADSKSIFHATTWPESMMTKLWSIFILYIKWLYKGL